MFWKQLCTEALRMPILTWLDVKITAQMLHPQHQNPNPGAGSKVKIRLWFYYASVFRNSQLKVILISIQDQAFSSLTFMFRSQILPKHLRKSINKTLQSLFCFIEEQDLYDTLRKDTVLILPNLFTSPSLLVVKCLKVNRQAPQIPWASLYTI